MRRGLRFFVLIREDKKVQTFADVIQNVATSPQLLHPAAESCPGRALNPQLPALQSGALPTEITGQRKFEMVAPSISTFILSLVKGGPITTRL